MNIDLEEMEELHQLEQADQELYDFCQGEREEYDTNTLRTKDALLKSICATKAYYREKANGEHPHYTQAFYAQLDDLIERFHKQVLVQDLPEPLPDWWCYSYEITPAGIELLLNHHEWSHEYGGSYDCTCWRALTVLKTPAKMLTTGEFAKLQGVEDVTIRQWIRRGKIRSAVKHGNEWRISALTRLPKDRGYTSCAFYWEDALPELPEKWSWLNDFHCLYLTQSKRDRNRFLATLKVEQPRLWLGGDSLYIPEKSDSQVHQRLPKEKLDWKGRVILDASEREALELYLIGCPEAKLLDPTMTFDKLGLEDYCDVFMSIDLV